MVESHMLLPTKVCVIWDLYAWIYICVWVVLSIWHVLESATAPITTAHVHTFVHPSVKALVATLLIDRYAPLCPWGKFYMFCEEKMLLKKLHSLTEVFILKFSPIQMFCCKNTPKCTHFHCYYFMKIKNRFTKYLDTGKSSRVDNMCHKFWKTSQDCL